MPNFIANMRRMQLEHVGNSEHAGLLLDKGFLVWAKDPVTQDDKNIKQHNIAAHDLHLEAAGIGYSEPYKKAYDNWYQHQIENGENSKVWFGTLENRMFLGMGEASPLEAGITLHHTYGVPFIPGSAIKGVLSHYANEFAVSDKEKELLFGREASPAKKQDNGASGYLNFNDAWWLPEDKALAPEMITVHAQKYYNKKGKDAPHPDFESPNPNPQIAIQGSFLFSVEGDANLVEFGIKLLEEVMTARGIGAKGASGYGYFSINKKNNERKIKSFKADQNDFNIKLKEKRKDADFDALNNNEKTIKVFEENFNNIQQLPISLIKQDYLTHAAPAKEFITTAINDFNENEKKQAQSLLNQFYEFIGWYKPGTDKKKREKQKEKKKNAINQLF